MIDDGVLFSNYRSKKKRLSSTSLIGPLPRTRDFDHYLMDIYEPF